MPYKLETKKTVNYTHVIDEIHMLIPKCEESLIQFIKLSSNVLYTLEHQDLIKIVIKQPNTTER